MVDGYQMIANSVVEQAANDYRVALVRQHDGDVRADAKVEDLEAFFTGKLIKLYTKLDGTMLMRAIKDEVIKHNYDLKAIRDSHMVGC